MLWLLLLLPPPPHVLTVAPATWHRRLGYPGPAALSSLSRSSFTNCIINKHDIHHVCQLGKHIRLPFSISSNRVNATFDSIHLDL
jgi:hypothetical protein